MAELTADLKFGFELLDEADFFILVSNLVLEREELVRNGVADDVDLADGAFDKEINDVVAEQMLGHQFGTRSEFWELLDAHVITSAGALVLPDARAPSDTPS